MAREKKLVGWGEARSDLDEVTDGTVLLLKGHLLVEEALYTMIQRKFPRPEFFLESNPRFAQLLNVAKSFFYDDEDKNLWDSIHALNRLRNKLAHNFKPGDISIDFRTFAFEKFQPAPNQTINDQEIMIAVAASIGMVLGGLSKLLQAERAK